MTKEKEELMNKINNSKFVGLEEILVLLGSKKPFKKNGELSIYGEDARQTLISVVNGLECIGAIRITSRNFEDYIDEIIAQNY